jgi:Uma2 family endonuclease
MAGAGVFATDERVELLEGWVVRKMTQLPPHATALDCVVEVLAGMLPTGWRTREQKPIHPQDSAPEPDVALVRGDARRYRQRHPGPKDIGLVIEVADTTLATERTFKTRLYARARITVYWVVNLVDAQVEVYTDPTGGRAPGYRRRTDYAIDQSVPLVLEGREVGRVRVRDLMP